MKIEKRAKGKREEITEIVKGVIHDYAIESGEEVTNSKVEEISSGIINHFVDITAPEVESKSDLLMIRRDVMGGGTSMKPGNIYLNWKKLFVDGSEAILTIAGTIALPWLIPLAGLVVLKKIQSILSVQITESQAAVIHTIWANRDTENSIKSEIVLDLVNLELSEYNRPEMSQKELNMILMDLEKMKCIEKINENKLWLREEVKVDYG